MCIFCVIAMKRFIFNRIFSKQNVLATEIYSSLKPIYTISKIFLILPFTINKNKPKFIITKFDICIHVIKTAFYLKCSYDIFTKFYAFKHPGTSLEKAFDAIHFGQLFLNITVNLTIFYIFKRTVSELFSKIIKLEAKMTHLFINIDYNKYFIRNIVMIIFFILVNLISNLMSILMKDDLPFLYFTYLAISNQMASTVFCFFETILFDAEKIFQGINKKLNALSNLDTISSTETRTNVFTEKILSQILSIPDTLILQCKEVNTILNFPLLLMACNTFFQFVCTMQNILYNIIQGEFPNLSKIVIITLDWNTYNLSVLVFILIRFNGIRHQVFSYLIMY